MAMKLVIAIIRDKDDDAVIQALLQQEYRVTRMSSTGGFLKQGNVTLLIGVREERLEGALAVVRESCSPPDDRYQHRATIFVVDMPHFEQV